jgi:hypothetical protein
MTNHKISPHLEQLMKTHRNILPLLGAIVAACAILAAPSAQAQTVSVVNGTLKGTVAGTAATVKAGTVDNETVTFTGPFSISANWIPDPAGGPATMALFLDATSVVGTGASTLTKYANSAQASLTRVYLTADTVKATVAFQPNNATGYLHARTALVTVNLTFNPTTHAISGVTGSLANFVP